MKELAKIPNPPKTGKASKKPSPKGIRETSATKATKPPAGGDAARLRNSVNKNCDGKMTGARILVELQKAGTETKTKKKRGPQPWVKRICSEPEWTGPWEDEDTRHDASKLPLSEPDVPAN